MPNMNGYEFTRTLRERGYTKPIFGITASSVGEEIDDLIAAGATCSLVKPLAIKDIKQAIARCQQNKQ
jgi:two-component system capsular synthesis sensor histidine kinase RcsC